eukprot:CAMPEP_0115714104 /NCGR_PEP_ID=MMETSP0272-20121206/75043_1 /TAXON_ID=71861 /ORGANISM="Scrippsiella trochoidea, Strain CCMP3099" /LENGTH=65 /DNA_ID=CAMNT_0003156191 /DNA_START=84 /DNA_END=281 /DNA_ORIENTATION=-
MRRYYDVRPRRLANKAAQNLLVFLDLGLMTVAAADEDSSPPPCGASADAADDDCAGAASWHSTSQ